MALVFVYGTLKRGKSNHKYLVGQEFVGLAMTEPRYRLFGLDGFPGMIPDKVEGTSIEGEVWNVDARCLETLDELEGTREGLYCRERVLLEEPFKSANVETYLFLRDVTGRTDLGPRYD